MKFKYFLFGGVIGYGLQLVSSGTFQIGCLPRLSLSKPPRQSIHDLIAKFAQSQINFDRDNENFVTRSAQAVVGRGSEDFSQWSDKLIALQASNLGWAFAEGLQYPIRPGDTIVTVTKFYGLPLWSVNPSRVRLVRANDRQRDPSRIAESQIVYETVHGHFLAGRETLTVTLRCDNAVVLKVATESRGFGILGAVFMPLLRPLQRRFLLDHFRGCDGVDQSSL